MAGHDGRGGSGKGRTGYLIGKMEVGKYYTVEAVEEIFSENINDPDNLWGILNRPETKSIFTNLRRAKCYGVVYECNPRRIMLPEPYKPRKKVVSILLKAANDFISGRGEYSRAWFGGYNGR